MTTGLDIETQISNKESYARSGEKYLLKNEPIHYFTVAASPLNSLLVEANAPKQMDFLSLDVEGGELEVLKGINHEQFRFNYALVESTNLEPLEIYLNSVDYQLLEKMSEHDYLFVDARIALTL
jgi:hypothetical protein